MAIAQDVFTIAMTLMDEVTQDGTYTGYPEEYKKKSWTVLTLLQAEVLPDTDFPTMVTGPDDWLQVDDQTCLTVLPYGLAAHLLLTNDPNRAVFFNDRYDELKRKIPSDIEIGFIDDVYKM